MHHDPEEPIGPPVEQPPLLVEHAEPVPVVPDPLVFDEEAALSYVGSRRMLLHAVEAFAATVPENVSIMRSALAMEDWSLLQSEAHGLKGALGMLGAPAASSAAQRLEILCRRGNPGEIGGAFDALERELTRLHAVLEARPLRATDLREGGEGSASKGGR